jgi:hypothetical protein
MRGLPPRYMPPGRSLLLFTRLARVPGYEHSGKAKQYQRERYRAPPVLPEGTKAVGALTPGPEDAEKQENGADNLANPTHSSQAILRLLSLPGAPFCRGAACLLSPARHQQTKLQSTMRSTPVHALGASEARKVAGPTTADRLSMHADRAALAPLMHGPGGAV